MTADTGSRPETHEFRAGIKQLLDILVHSVYTAKDVFIRELVSNASDALEKVRFLTVRGEEVVDAEAPLEIRISTDEVDGRKRFIIEDTGIGMTADELKENLGTIAQSGAAAFAEKMAEGAADGLSLIGRFGIGFYSVFMAAEKVVVTSRAADPGAKPVRWTSDGLGTYTVETLDEEIPRGTRIEAVLREGEERFAEESAIEEAIRRYSNFVPFPVKVGDEQKNRTQALWREQPSQVKDEDYTEFYKLLTNDVDDPALHLHTTADSPIQFSSLLFVPKSNPEVMGFGEGEVNLHLYVKRVLIDGENKDLLPRHLRFVRGVVESEDLPLNISRESLQENRFIQKIRDVLTKRILDRFQKLAKDDPDEYLTLWRTYGRILKEGHGDFANRERLHELLRFNSSHHDDPEGLTGLADYVERMPEAQKSVYYLSGPSREALASDPRLELFRKKGIEVLYLYELADEFVLSGIGTYKEKGFASADQVNPDDLADLPDTSSDDTDTPDEKGVLEGADLDALLGAFRSTLGDRVTDVKVSQRLVGSPACLVNEDGMSGHMDKVMRMMNKDQELPKRTLEINPKHPMVRSLGGLVKNDASDPFVGRAVEQIFESAMLTDGYLTDPHRLVERMQEILTDAAASRLREKGGTPASATAAEATGDEGDGGDDPSDSASTDDGGTTQPGA